MSPATCRLAVPVGATPIPNLPFIRVSRLMFNWASWLLIMASSREVCELRFALSLDGRPNRPTKAKALAAILTTIINTKAIAYGWALSQPDRPLLGSSSIFEGGGTSFSGWTLGIATGGTAQVRSEEHTSELQSQ